MIQFGSEQSQDLVSFAAQDDDKPVNRAEERVSCHVVFKVREASN